MKNSFDTTHRLNEKQIILIAYKFPPYAGVGAYRWSKLTKYFARMGMIVHVISIDWPKGMGENTLESDVDHPNIIIHRIPSGYSKWLTWLGKDKKIKLMSKVCNRLKWVGDKLIYFDDEAQYWGKHLVPYAEQLIKQNNIGVLIATGHPFQANRWAAVIKKRNPDVKLIQDLRDPWCRDPLKYWLWFYSKILNKWEKKTLQCADKVICVTEGLINHYQLVCPNNNYHCISNGVDCEILSDENVKHFTFVYIGNLGCGRGAPFNIFLNVFSKLVEKDSTLTCCIIGGGSNISPQYSHFINKNIFIIHNLSQKKAMSYVKASTFALQFNAEIYPYLVSTKIYEYAYLNTPILSFNYGGEIESLIKKHSFGYSLNVNTYSENKLIEKVKEILNKKCHKFDYECQSFYYPTLAKKYLKIIETVLVK